MSSGTRSYEMARRLVSAGHEVHMVTSDRATNNARSGWYETNEAGIHVHWIRVPYSNEMRSAQRIAAFARFSWLATFKAIILKADIIFATSTPLTIAIPALIASRVQRVPMVFEVRDLWPEVPIALGALNHPIMRWLALLLEWLAYHKAAHVVTLSPGMADGVRRRGIPADGITIIPNSCDVELFDVPARRGKRIRDRLIGIHLDQPLVLYAGAFGRVNGLAYVVRLAEAMREFAPETWFLLVGEGTEREIILQEAEQRGVLNRNLWVWQPIPKQEMPDLFAAATVACSVVMPLKELEHNSANKFFDALAAGKPPVINYGGWQAELLEETGAGLALPPHNIEQAASMLASFLRDKKRLSRAGRAARTLARTRFHRDDMARQLEATLRRVADL
jgi:glycosyltransferase involved in cell wall biosynthesis